MKSEPLDGKRKTIFGERIRLGVNEGVIFFNFPFIELDYFEFDDVKSAVMGLKTELDTWFDVNQDSWESGYVYRHLKKRVFEIIDKWFKDVIE